MMPPDCYRRLVAETRAAVAATVPPGHARTVLALLRAGDPTSLANDFTPISRPGWNLALRLCLERQGNENDDIDAERAMLTAWAEKFLADCDQLALANRVLAQCVSGDLQMQQQASGTFVAWGTSRRFSPEQRERADFEWWSAKLTRQVAPRLNTLRSERTRIRALLGQDRASILESALHVVSDPTIERYYRQIGEAYVSRFACQHGYPTDTEIGGATFGQYTDILALLIGWLHREHDRHALHDEYSATPLDERAIIVALADALDADPAVIEIALQPFILDRDNAAYHSALPGQAAPPLIRLDANHVVLSVRGLLGEPLLFLSRELRRRYAQEYHNRAHLREGGFRQDLYRLFSDRRFVLSTGRIELKRSGVARTDLDALIFDRKTGTLGVFELKAQDPFARSVEERQRQRDNFFHANHQVSAILEWIQRHGGDDLLVRFDERTAKRFHVQKVYVFVLGRYLAHFTDGPQPDRRAAWGSWPQVLQIVENGPFTSDSRNPIGTLFERLRDATPPSVPIDVGSQAIMVGGLSLRIFPSFAEMRAEEDHPV